MSLHTTDWSIIITVMAIIIISIFNSTIIVNIIRNETLECHAFLCPKRKMAQAATLTIAQVMTTLGSNVIILTKKFYNHE